MADAEKFSEKLTERLTRQRVKNMQQQGSLDRDMQDLIMRRDAFRADARRMLTSFVLPRMRTVARHFDNAVVEEPKGADFRCACRFSHTARFPATAAVAIAIMPGDRHSDMVLHHAAEILPEFIDYEKHSEHCFSPGQRSDEKVVSWVEEQMLRFLDAYLRLETHPLYQKDNLVTDPVCGMRLPLAHAAGSVERAGREIYFCSVGCREAYLRETL